MLPETGDGKSQGAEEVALQFTVPWQLALLNRFKDWLVIACPLTPVNVILAVPSITPQRGNTVKEIATICGLFTAP
jgi:hypothetical protein